MITSKGNLQSSNDVAIASPSSPHPTLARKIHNQNDPYFMIKTK
jgi:hypothetical protein